MIWPPWVSDLLQAVVVLGVSGVWNEFRKLNGRLGRLEEWRSNHAKLDDERHGEQREEINALWQHVHGRERLPQ